MIIIIIIIVIVTDTEWDDGERATIVEVSRFIMSSFINRIG